MSVAGSATSRPAATTLSRMSRSVMIPAGAPAASSTMSELIRLRDMIAAAAWIESPVGAVTTLPVASSPTGVVKSSRSPPPTRMLRVRISWSVLSRYLLKKVRCRYSRIWGLASRRRRKSGLSIR